MALPAALARLFRFKRLQTRLTTLYAALFGAVLVLLAVGLQVGISGQARRETGAQLASSGTVFSRVWALHADRLQQGAEVLAQDFGFRQAVATGDPATALSAVQNLQRRLKVERAMILRGDGSVLSTAGAQGMDAAKLIAALDPYRASNGVLTIEGQPFFAVAAPIPDGEQGWVMFAVKLGRPELTALEKMSAIPIKADIYTASHMAKGRLAELIAKAQKGETAKPREIVIDGAPALTLVKRLTALDGGADMSLVLSYPMAAAMAPYHRTLELLAVIGLFGVALMTLGGWIVARDVTKPVRALDDAAQALEQGRHVDLVIHGQDELARLATNFNRMASTIREREAHITGLAHRDVETGMGNRRALERDLATLLSREDGGRVVAAVFGIDRFAKVRGAIGHAHAQHLVALCGERLAELTGDTVVRLSTSSLAAAFRCADEAEARSRLESVVQGMRASFRLAGTSIDITMTCGFALAEAGAQPDVLIEHASIALDQAVTSGLRIAAYDPEAYGDPALNLSLMSELMGAIGSSQFSLAYQPKYDLRRGEITGVEALSRWSHPTRGAISPDLFVTMAEETGHIGEMTDWTLRQAMTDQSRLAAAGHVLQMSVNLSGRLLADDAFMERTLGGLKGRTGPLCLEITETAVIDNPDRAMRNIARLRDADVALSIDDYGSGLSSLAYLRDLHAQELKIDKAFVLRMDVTAKDALLVRSTVDMAHSLGLKVTAEGVETAATQALLAGMGCDLAQGYFIARPMAMAALERFMAAQGAAQAPEATRAVG